MSFRGGSRAARGESHYERNIYTHTTPLNRSDDLKYNFYPKHLENP